MPRKSVGIRTFANTHATKASQLRNGIPEREHEYVKDRKLNGINARRLQHIGRQCSRWAAWRGTSDVHSPMLAAATLSIDRLIAFLDDLTAEVCNITERDPVRWVPIQTDEAEVDWRSDLFVLLDAVERIRPVVAGQEELDSIGFPDEYVTVWRSGSVEELGYVHRALGDDFTDLMKTWHKLPSDIRILARLQDATKRVYGDLKATVQRASEHNPASLADERRRVARALGEARTLAMARQSRWWHWCSSTQEIVDAIDNWTSKPWTEGLGHTQNQSFQNQLRRDLAYLRQYAILMRATSQRYRMLLRLDALFALVRRITFRLTRQFGPPTTRCPSDIVKLFRVDLVEPEWRERWMALPEDLQEHAQKAIGIVMKEGQRMPWLVGEFMDAFLRADMVGGKSLDTKKRRIVDEILVPMQLVGLAAQVPWDELFSGPEEKPATVLVKFGTDVSAVRTASAARMPKGYHGRKWVVNPFGVRLRGG